MVIVENVANIGRSESVSLILRDPESRNVCEPNATQNADTHCSLISFVFFCCCSGGGVGGGGSGADGDERLPFLLELNPDGSEVRQSGVAGAVRRHLLPPTVTEVGTERPSQPHPAAASPVPGETFTDNNNTP